MILALVFRMAFLLAVFALWSTILHSCGIASTDPNYLWLYFGGVGMTVAGQVVEATSRLFEEGY